jgi:hypothetical protein
MINPPTELDDDISPTPHNSRMINPPTQLDDTSTNRTG